MKFKISKSQWTEMGKKAGWIKCSKIVGPNVCPGCELLVDNKLPSVVIEGQKWHKVCFNEEQRIQKSQAEQDRDYDTQV